MEEKERQSIMTGFAYSPEEYGLAELSGIKISELYSDVRLQVETSRRVNEIIAEALDMPLAPPALVVGHVKSAEYMGCKVFQPEDDEPFVKSPVLSDIGEVAAFQCLDPCDNPVARNYLQTCKEFYDLTGEKQSIQFIGPFTTAAFMRGQTDFLTDWVLSPELAQALMVLVTQAIADWKKYHDAEMGIDGEGAAELIDDSITLVSPSDFEQRVLPSLKHWFEMFPADERHFHCCGDISSHLQALSKLGMTHYMLMGEMIHADEAKTVLGDIEISQLLDFRILRDGKGDDIRRHIQDLLAHAPRDSNYCLAVEGARGLSLETVCLVKDIVMESNSDLEM